MKVIITVTDEVMVKGELKEVAARLQEVGLFEAQVVPSLGLIRGRVSPDDHPDLRPVAGVKLVEISQEP